MIVDSGNEHIILFCRELRFGYLHTFHAIAFNPNFGYRMQMPSPPSENMDMATIIICIKWYCHKYKCFQECQLSHIVLFYKCKDNDIFLIICIISSKKVHKK